MHARPVETDLREVLFIDNTKVKVDSVSTKCSSFVKQVYFCGTRTISNVLKLFVIA